MIYFAQITCLAFILDLILGDPRYRFHPVILIGKLARFLERKMNHGDGTLFKGALSALFVYVTVISFVAVIRWLTPSSLLMIVDILLLYTCFALKSLDEHAKAVLRALEQGDIELARLKLGYIVGRKTQNLNEEEICRGVIETVAENSVDGITAPLFYSFIAGPYGAFLYKAVNTLDSLWGHRNERFEKFGKFAARVDDLFNFIPARITAPLISLSSKMKRESFKVLLRDGKKHPSPNSGLSEAAMAGGLGVRLGGMNYYEGYESFRVYMGNPIHKLSKEKISEAIKTVYLTSLIFLFIIIFFIALTYKV
ncbi:MAG: adenosylcobinamide-phosphate synthase CbiB [Bdellovibrionales bacterium]|nr:adenosylcobinamide-phosphate synthase CbiB [Bdellovibrionales bacterium]